MLPTLSYMLYCFVWFVFMLKFFAVLTKGYCKANVCLVGKTAIVTGGNSGMGFQISLNLASRGCRVIIADVADATVSVREIIEKTGNANIAYMFLDLASLKSIRKFASNVIANEKRLDILINNAGCAGFNTKTEDGIYKVLQINYLGHFLLTSLLTPLLKETKNSRVVFVSSLLAFTNNLTDGLNINKVSNSYYGSLNGMLDYGNSKICMLVATKLFAQKLEKSGTIVTASHPGLVQTLIFDTCFSNMKISNWNDHISKTFINICLKIFGKTSFEGIQSTLHCALSEHVKPGNYIVDCKNFMQPSQVYKSKFCQNVWQESVRLAELTKEEEVC